ncbi:MAG: site-specific integrase [Nannocystis sp.]|nr:site-specific integrase [Nannocystis sp.]
MEVTTRPYFKDRTRQHVDINLTHPLDPSKPVRRRVVAPAGMDAIAAVEWGRAEALKLYRALCHPVGVRVQKRGAIKPDAKPTPPPIKTLAEFWPIFEASHVAELKHSTRDHYETAWANIRPLLGALRLDEVDEKALAQLRTHMRQERGLSQGYTRQTCEAVRVALRHARSDGALPKGHELPQIAWPKQRRAKVDVYSRDDLEVLVASARNTEERVLYLLLADAALRIGECAGLMWKDIRLEERTMVIRRNVSRGRLQDTAKGEDGEVTLSPRLAEALRGFRPRGEFVFMPDGWFSVHSVVRARKPHVQEGTLAMRVRNAQKRAGLPVYGPHRIRHSVLTLLAQKGVSPYALQALARHAQLSTTMRYYVHLKQSALAAQAVAALTAPDAEGNGAAREERSPVDLA